MTAHVQESSGDRFTLARPPIEVAAAELRYPATGPEIPQKVALELRSRLRAIGLRMDGLEQSVQQEFSLEVSPDKAAASSNISSRGWQMTDSHQGLTLAIMPTSLSVQITAYARWSKSLEPVLREACEVLRDLVGLELRSRVGLRYINRFTNPEALSAADWVGRFDGNLLGPVAGGPLAGTVVSAQQQLELDFADGVVGVLRHGPFVDAAVNRTYSYLLDIDIFNTSTEQFDPSQTLELWRRLNRRAASLFKALMSDELSSERGLQIEPPHAAAGQSPSNAACDLP